ncbi:MAG: prepilin-type N-terminal cleavage/methylation domain-containing protein [Puniceicoccales bacterium]|jgi:prepilin-type N-terminal cleavage/methylation domain-containing protein/prepilin-type processing-associated H-X9-DG protein|nr:prepilin-type N-terminal cleavage/methylation domain-containing protein [Puniceicoccales bacterium]
MNIWKRGKGFTLIELLIAIVIIGILMSLLIPAVNKIMENARRLKGLNSLKQIATAYTQYSNDDVNGRNIDAGNSPTGIIWATKLAQAGYLNDPTVYCFSGDNGASRVLKKIIATSATTDGSDAWGSVPGTESDQEFSVWVISNVPTDAPAATTPIAFTRGLPADGKWPNSGVYGTKGGYIAFLDGHVEWYDNLGTGEDEGQLVNWDTGKATNSIQDTIPDSAQILSASGGDGGSVKGNGTSPTFGGGS